MPWEIIKAKLNTWNDDNNIKVLVKQEGSAYSDPGWQDSSVLEDWELVNVVETADKAHVGIFKRFKQSREDIDL